MRLAVTMALLAITGCAGGTGPDAQCRRQAYDDPAVQDAIERSNSSMDSVRAPALMEEDDLVRRATQKCLAALGLAPPGGVEAIKRY